MMLFNRLKTPSTAIPSSLNGSVSIQKTGYSTKAKIATGQQRIKRMIQTKNVTIGEDNYRLSASEVNYMNGMLTPA